MTPRRRVRAAGKVPLPSCLDAESRRELQVVLGTGAACPVVNPYTGAQQPLIDVLDAVTVRFVKFRSSHRVPGAPDVRAELARVARAARELHDALEGLSPDSLGFLSREPVSDPAYARLFREVGAEPIIGRLVMALLHPIAVMANAASTLSKPEPGRAVDTWRDGFAEGVARLLLAAGIEVLPTRRSTYTKVLAVLLNFVAESFHLKPTEDLLYVSRRGLARLQNSARPPVK